MTDKDTSLDPAEIFEATSAETGLDDEIRLARTRLCLAVQAGDDKSILNWLAMVHALVRVQEGLGDGDTELQSLLARVGDEVRLAR